MTDWGEVGNPGHDTLPLPSGPVEADLGPRPDWLLLAAAAAALAAALALAGGFALNLFGYLAASFAVFTLVALFRRSSVRRSAQLGVSPPRNLNLASLALVAIGFALSLVHAWLIASHLA
jgi:hypothetical protein